MGQVISLLAKFEQEPGRYVQAEYSVQDVSFSYGMELIIQEINKHRMPYGDLKILSCKAGKRNLHQSMWRTDANEGELHMDAEHLRIWDINHDGGHLCDAWPDRCDCPIVSVL